MRCEICGIEKEVKEVTFIEEGRKRKGYICKKCQE
jgi:protein-arginine kinase activator protein McsA